MIFTGMISNLRNQICVIQAICSHVSLYSGLFRFYQKGHLNTSNAWRFLKELKIDLPYDPAIALLGIYPKDTDAVKRRDTCTPMFLAAMSTIAKLWKEPRCPSKDEWIKKMWSMYRMEYYSAIRNDKYPPFASTWMELEGIMLSEVSQSEKDKHCMFSFTWGI